jgi:hypothetical protein
MDTQLELEILSQPDETTCGPTCLQAVYRYYGDELPLDQVIRESPRLQEGGTLAVMLACHALRRGYQATIYTYNLQVFDPTWFFPVPRPLDERLAAQIDVKSSPKLEAASLGYLEFLRRGGEMRMEDLNRALIRKHLKRGEPILTGLSATYLYRDAREIGEINKPDDVRGEPSGHFVVLCGYDHDRRTVRVADPYLPNPLGRGNYYDIDVDRVICAILLGIVTYDANLLILTPPRPGKAL